ncbi:hypothetical protein FRC03_000866 [Tulasnella sp. 419]|nr:hypothetical protein FRC03_000866 [Tulasnella sp. 419]
MVIITPEKAEPPPYTAVDPLPESSQRLLPPSSPNHVAPSSTPSLRPPLPARRSISVERPLTPEIGSVGSDHPPLRIVKSQEDITGHYKIFPGSGASSSNPSSSSKAASAPDGVLETQKGKIDVSIDWVAGKSIDTVSRACIEAINYDGSINVATSIRTSGLPVHIKATSHKHGDVKIRVPTDFSGVLSLRVLGSQPWRTRIGLSPSLKDQIACTRETALAPKVKGKGKDRSQDDKSSESTLVEYLIGPQLDASALNRTTECGPGSLDLVEAESKDGKIWIYAYAVEAMDEGTKDQIDLRSSTDAKKPSAFFSTSGVSVSMERAGGSGKPNLSTIAIVVEEPRWLESARRMFGFKSGGSSGSVDGSIKSKANDCSKEKANDLMHGLTGWLHTPKNPSASSTPSLAGGDTLSHSTPSTPSPKNSPLRSPRGSPQRDTHLHPIYSPPSSQSRLHKTHSNTTEQTAFRHRGQPPFVKMAPTSGLHFRSSSSPGSNALNTTGLAPPVHPNIRHPQCRSAENLTLIHPSTVPDLGRYPTPPRKSSSGNERAESTKSKSSTVKRHEASRGADLEWYPHWMVPSNTLDHRGYQNTGSSGYMSSSVELSPRRSSTSPSSASIAAQSQSTSSSSQSRVLTKTRRGRSSSNPDPRSPQYGSLSRGQPALLTKPHR